MTFLSAIKLADEPGRRAALLRYEVLDTEPEREFADIIGLVRTLFRAPIVAIGLMDADRLWFKSVAGLDAAEAPRAVAFCDHTIRGSAPLVVEDTRQDPRFATNPLVTGGAGASGVRCYLGAPLTTPEGYNVGTLCVMGHEPRAFTPADEEVLAHFARLVVSQLELRLLARRDALTGALSRRAFQSDLETAAVEAGAANAPPSHSPATLLLLDLDHFKFVNDRFGHPAGDEVLRAVVEVVEAELGAGDRLGRLGGEEFGVLLRGRGPGEARARAERVRRSVAAVRVPGLGEHRGTVSGGLAPWDPGRPEVAAWVAAADVALYAAKRGGRDRVEVAGEALVAGAGAAGAVGLKAMMAAAPPVTTPEASPLHASVP